MEELRIIPFAIIIFQNKWREFLYSACPPSTTLLSPAPPTLASSLQSKTKNRSLKSKVCHQSQRILHNLRKRNRLKSLSRKAFSRPYSRDWQSSVTRTCPITTLGAWKPRNDVLLSTLYFRISREGSEPIKTKESTFQLSFFAHLPLNQGDLRRCPEACLHLRAITPFYKILCITHVMTSF